MMNFSSEQSRSTIDDVAELAGVSIATVSRVVNGTGQVSPKTAARVLAAVERLNYKPNAAARGLASRRTNTIGLILDAVGGEYFQPMLYGIEAAARGSGYDLLINSTRGVNKPGGYAIGEHNADGMIVFADSLPQDEIVRLHGLGFPLVLLHRSSPPGLHIPCVTVENKSGARRMMDYLIEERGWRRIAFLRGPESHEDSYWREMGYREALAAHHIPFRAEWVREGGFSDEVAYSTVSAWIQEGLEVEAIFAGDDDSAVGALLALKDAGRRVPEDVAVVGFDDIRLARYLEPPLTTVKAPIESVGRTAVEQLVRLIRTGEADPLTLLPTELVIRKSCGAP